MGDPIRTSLDQDAEEARFRKAVDGAVSGHIAHALLIDDENRELEHKVAERTLELEVAVTELESFAYSISHDLRAPLRAIDGFSAILAADEMDALSEQGRRYLRMIRRSAQNMQQLVDGLLGFSRLAQHPLGKQACSPRVLAQQALSQLGQDPQSADVEIDIQPMPECFGDPVLLVQVWANLIGNALKFRRLGTVCHIEIGCRIEAEKAPHYFVADNGIGMDPKYAHKIFGVFQRLNHAEDFEGTGVGLANVKRILHRHGGVIGVESELGAGTTFLFTIPKEEPPHE